MHIKRQFTEEIYNHIKSYTNKIHVFIGPRQVGKTTAAKEIAKSFNISKYETADGFIPKDGSWLNILWDQAIEEKCELLIIDEIQKVSNWSEALKRIWDLRGDKHPTLIILGSSSLDLNKGLSESLTGRFINHNFSHWTFDESKKLYNFCIEDFLKFGGYPGSYEFIKDEILWGNYLKQSIIDTVIGKDILTQVHIKSPILFRQSFDLICGYSAQEISYTKLLGNLQDKGNTELIKNFISYFEGAYLIKEIKKYSGKLLKQRTSSPKIISLCPSLFYAAKNMHFTDEDYGHAFESFIGALLLRKSGNLYYWREGNFEVDYVYEEKNQLHAIEVKYNRVTSTQGLEKFLTYYPNAKTHIITKDNFTSHSLFSPQVPGTACK